jgi:RNA polymerase sigma-70 factor, ECF subfamily
VASDLKPEALGDHLDRLQRAARALCRTREDAEDLVQDTLVRVIAIRPALRSPGAALPYLLAALRHTFASELRSRDRRPRTAPLWRAALLPAVAPASPAASLATRELLAAIAELPAGQREAMVAVDLAGLSYAEAARALAVSPGTVMSRLHRGRHRVAAAVG